MGRVKELMMELQQQLEEQEENKELMPDRVWEMLRIAQSLEAKLDKAQSWRSRWKDWVAGAVVGVLLSEGFRQAVLYFGEKI